MTLFLGGALLGGYFWYRYEHRPERTKQKEVEKWVSIIGEKVLLPAGEEPTLAAVTNKDRFDDQAFFRDAENGDIMLLYSNVRRAYLYRPSSGKIIGMADLNIEKEIRE